MGKKVVVIGAGLSGLCNALLLAKKGYSVRILEALDKPGGVARVYKEDGYTFDMGPSWYLMPEVFEHLFDTAGIPKEERYKLKDISPSYRVFFDIKDSVDITRDIKANQAIFDSFEKDGGKKLEKYLKKCKFKYDVAVGKFLYKDYRHFTDFMNLKIISDGIRLDPLLNLDAYVSLWFSSPKAKKILEFNTVFLGSSPFTTPALYSLMAHVDLTQGIFLPEGGINRVVDFLVEQNQKAGVTIEYNKRVTGISVSQGRSDGVLVGDLKIGADLVLCTTDYHHGETELLEPRYRNYSQSYWKSRVMAPSTLLLYLGIKGKVQGLVHHNFYFSKNWKECFDSIFNKPSLPEDPSYYIGCASKTDPSLAPSDGENLFILVPLAPDLGAAKEEMEDYGRGIIEHLEGLIGESLSDRIVVKKMYYGEDFKSINNLYKGTALGLSHTLFQTAIFRPSHKNKKLSNFYYAGHYTQPGIGMPMAFIGAELVSELIHAENG